MQALSLGVAGLRGRLRPALGRRYVGPAGAARNVPFFGLQNELGITLNLFRSATAGLVPVER